MTKAALSSVTITTVNKSVRKTCLSITVKKFQIILSIQSK